MHLPSTKQLRYLVALDDHKHFGQAAAAFVERLRALPGEVWVPSHGSYPWLAGKPFRVASDPLLDLVYSGYPAFPDDLERDLRAGRFSSVLLDGPLPEPRLARALEAGYGRPAELSDAPATRVMYRTAPRLLYRPKEARADPR